MVPMTEMTMPRTHQVVAKRAAMQALLDAADAWDAMSPEERHAFACQHRAALKVYPMPSTWLRARAGVLKGRSGD